MPIKYVFVMLFAYNACWDLVLGRVAMWNKHMLC